MSSSSVETLSPRSTQDEDKMLCDILKKSKNEINIIIDNILLTIKDLKNIIHNDEYRKSNFESYYEDSNIESYNNSIRLLERIYNILIKDRDIDIIDIEYYIKNIIIN